MEFITVHFWYVTDFQYKFLLYFLYIFEQIAMQSSKAVLWRVAGLAKFAQNRPEFQLLGDIYAKPQSGKETLECIKSKYFYTLS